MDIKAMQLCSRMALKPNELGYCGRESAPAKFRKCIVEGKCEGVGEEIEKFIVLNPYLETIAEVTGKDKFSYEVVEAYWLGNDLLNKIKPKHYEVLIRNLRKQGVPKFLIEEIKSKKPKELVPVHLFNILHVGVGKASGSVPFNLESINDCMVRWGKVVSSIEYQVSSIKIRLKSIQMRNGKYELAWKEEKVRMDRKLVAGLKKGDMVAVHWGYIAKKLTNKEVLNLEKWTKKLLESLS